MKWLNGQGFDSDDLGKADFIIQKIDEHIQGTTNAYVQVVKLIGRKKSANKSFDHFITDVCEHVKRCTLDKVTNVTDWFTTMIIIANHDDTEVRKKLLLHQELKLDKAKAICKEEEKAAKTSRMLGASRTSSSYNYGLSQVQSSESVASVSSYQSNRGRKRQPTWRPWWTMKRPRRFPTTRLRTIPIERTFRQLRSFRKQRSISIKGPKHKALLQVRQISSRHVSSD